MRSIDLGATLYFPATRDDLESIARGGVPGLRSAVVCLEDAVADRDVGLALGRVRALLAALRGGAPAVRLYVRPRTPAMLAGVARLPGIGRIEGFVLPKTNAANLASWLAALPRTGHRLMPTIEGVEAFDRDALARLRDALAPHAERVTAVRIGGNDVLGLLGARRSRVRTAYDGPLANVVRDVAGAFLPAGFDVSAPVFEHYGAPDVLVREVQIDLEHGLLTKTAIHPSQVPLIHAAYRPGADEFDDARRILAPDAPAVFGRRDSLCEPATHRGWAERVIERHRVHGAAGPDASDAPDGPAAPGTGPARPTRAQRPVPTAVTGASATPSASSASKVSPPVASPRSRW